MKRKQPLLMFLHFRRKNKTTVATRLRTYQQAILPLLGVYLLTYAVTVVVTVAAERQRDRELRQMMQQEGRYLASLIGEQLR